MAGELLLFGLAKRGHQGGRAFQGHQVEQGAVAGPADDVFGPENGRSESFVIQVTKGEDVGLLVRRCPRPAGEDQGWPAIAQKAHP